MAGVWLVNNWSNPMGSDNGPDEEGNACCGDDVGLDREQVTNLVNREPDGWEGAKPEDEERDEITGIGARVWDAVGNVHK
jgi:hypothetical protein